MDHEFGFRSSEVELSHNDLEVMDKSVVNAPAFFNPNISTILCNDFDL